MLQNWARLVVVIAVVSGSACIPLLPPAGPEGADDTGFIDGGGTFIEAGNAGEVIGGTGGPLLPPVAEPESEEEQLTQSFFLARAIDPASEDSAGPKFAVVGDIDRDGLPDVATGWNQSQVIQIHLQRRDADDNVSFETVQVAGTTPIAIIAGVELADMDADGWLDLVVLVKHQGLTPFCPLNGEPFEDAFTGVLLVLFSPGGDVTNGADWAEVTIFESLEVNPPQVGGIPPGRPGDGAREIDVPEEGGMSAMDVGDVSGDGLPDVVITSNRPDEPCHPRGENDVELYVNPGSANARIGTAWPQILVDRDAPPLKDVVLSDIDRDGRLDILITRPTAASGNISWRRNLGSNTFDFRRPIGMIDGGADVMTLGDIDQDGLTDVVVRSNAGRVIQWFRHPSSNDDLNVSDTLPPRPDIPWAVYTLLDLGEREPLGLSMGDINFDGQPEILLGASGSIFWVDSSTAPTVFDPWSANLIVDDAQLDNQLFTATGPALINDLLVFDIDCDGATDIIGTMDRQSLSGLGNDVLIWFRNVLTPEDVGLDNAVQIPGCKLPKVEGLR